MRRLLLSLTLWLAPAAAFALDGGVIRWSGRVDGEVTLLVQGDEIHRQDERGDPDRDDRVTVSDPLPEAAVLVYVRTLKGRALVSLDEQPERRNDYTATVVIESQRRAPETVEFELLWLEARPGDHTSGPGYSQGGGAPPPPVPPPPGRPTTGPTGRPIDWLRWRGTVDGADYIDLRADKVTVEHLSNLPVQAMDYRVSAPLPERVLDLELVKITGRGKVKVVSEPSAANGFTARVLLDDRDQRGAADYEFELRWERPKDVRIGGGGKPKDTLLWSARVDGTDVISVRGREIQVEHLAGRPLADAESLFTAPLPRRALQVNLELLEGRGKATIVEQPSEKNDYALKVRIEDSKGGDDDYRLELSWEK